VEGLEIGNSVGLVVQFTLHRLDLPHVLHVLRLLRPQVDDISGPKVSENAVMSNGLGDLVRGRAGIDAFHTLTWFLGGPPLCS
jgi:hypothetical protein